MAETAPELQAVLDDVTALERACAASERSLMNRDWAGFDQAVADQRRITHSLELGMAQAASQRTEAFDKHVFKRLEVVFGFRENQLSRLGTYQGELSERLQSLGRFKQLARRLRKDRPGSALGSLDKLR